jgi:hypothetical protein
VDDSCPSCNKGQSTAEHATPGPSPLGSLGLVDTDEVSDASLQAAGAVAAGCEESDDEDPASIWLRRLSEKRQQEKIDASCACSQQDQAYFDATVHEGARNGDPSGTVGRCAGPRDDDGYDEEQSS